MAPKGSSPFSHGRSDWKQRPALAEGVRREQRRLGRRLRALRTERGLSQEGAAEEAGIHPKYLSRVEAGDANPSFAVLVALARAYDVSLADLVKR